jgi:two-component system chemotaxis sensor kinase CheA
MQSAAGPFARAAGAAFVMDDLLRDFIVETNESLERVDAELVRFEQEPNNARMLDNIFRLVHTIKGTCGFLALPRLEALTHAAEALMGKFRAGAPVTAPAVTLILATLDRIKQLLEELEQNRTEPEGGDDDLIAQLRQFAAHGKALPAAQRQAVPPPHRRAIAPRIRGPRTSNQKTGSPISPSACSSTPWNT